MTDNVVFPAQFSQMADPQRSNNSDGLETRNVRARVRLREIEAAPGLGIKGHIFRRRSDRIVAAQTVGMLVRQAKERNISVLSIQSALPFTKRLDRYMLSPDVTASAAEAQSRKLQQRVRGYLEAAEAVAKLTAQDADALKIQVLSGTSLWSDPSASQTEEDPRATHLSAELVEMGRAVARRMDLKATFAHARRIPGLWDIEAETFRASAAACLHQDFFLDLFEHWTEAPPLPSVALVRCVHAVFFATVRLEVVGRAELLIGEEAQDATFDAFELPAWFELSREIRLALGPTTSVDIVGPMFESRARVALVTLDPSPERYELSPRHTLKPIDTVFSTIPPGIFQVKMDGLWRRVAMTDSPSDMEGRLFGGASDPLAWSPDPLRPTSLPIEHWYVSWSAINPQSVRHWLDRKLGVEDTVVVTPDDGARPDQPVWYALGSTAHEIERNLASGGLEQALEGAVRQLGEQLKEWDAAWRAGAAAIHEERLGRWQQDT